jgi:GxxExxY protein
MLLESDVTERLLGAFFEVYRDLGFGFLEAIYSSALAVELDRRGMEVQREVPVEVVYAGVPVGRYRIDMVVERKVVVEIKATKTIGLAEQRQLLNYLKATDFEVGLLLHFGPNPGFKRLAYANSRKRHVLSR